jgi:hypothetical protein
MRALLPLLFVASCLAVTEEQASIVLPALQAAAGRFARIPTTPVDIGRWLSLPLNQTAVEAAGARLDCVRFTVPPQGGDLVWCFALPRASSSWYIVPVVGTGGGFTRFFRGRDYADAPYGSDHRQTTYLQSLDAANLTPGADYLLWFEFVRPEPSTLHLRLGFAPHRDRWDGQAIEAALGLEPATTEQREDRFDTRGGRLLRDSALLSQPFGRMRLTTLLHQLDGAPIAMTTASGRALPSIAAVRAAYGEPDRVIEHDPLIAAGLEKLGNGMPETGTAIILAAGLRTAWWDHVALTASGTDEPAVAITVDPRDRSWDSACHPGDTFDLIESAAVLCRDGAVVGVVADFCGAKARLAAGEPGAATWRRYEAAGWVDTEMEVDALGNGRLTSWSHPNVRAVAATLAAWAYHGDVRRFHVNGATRAIFTYQHGQLDGDAVWFDPDGTESKRDRYRAGVLVK